MCLLKNKIAKAQSLAIKREEATHPVPEAGEANTKPIVLKPVEDINSLKKALSAFTIKQEVHDTTASEAMSDSTDNECVSKKKNKKSAKSKKSSKAADKNQNGNGSPTKNIAINFGKAMASFALSHIAIPYIMMYIENSDLTLQDFFIFIKKNKKCIKSMQGLRSLLLVLEGDDKATAGYKRVFQQICELFVKNYSVNWITHSKLAYKLVYLKWRFKMLRRIRNPELFTHIC